MSNLVFQNYENRCKGWTNPASTNFGPQINSLSGYFSPAGSTTLVSIDGNNFYSYSIVSFGTFKPTPYFINSNNIQFYVPSTLNSGTYTVQIFNGSVGSNIASYEINNASGYWLLNSNGSLSNTNISDPTSGMVSIYTLSRGTPITISEPYTAINPYKVPNNSSWFICSATSTMYIELPSFTQFTGREITFRNISGSLIMSVSPSTEGNKVTSNIVLNGLNTDQILPGTIGAWATLVYNGTYWIIMQSSFV